jgi:hypothetical protein
MKRRAQKAVPVTALAIIAALVLGALTAAPSSAATSCTGPVGAIEIIGNVSAGAGCDLSGATVKGNVTVNPGGSLSTKEGSTTVIAGNLESSQATEISLEGATSVQGNIGLKGTSGRIYLSGSVKGNLIIEGGIPFLTVENEAVGGNLKVLNTSGGVSGEGGLVGISRSTVGGNVEVSNNSAIGIVTNAVSVHETTVGGNLKISNNSATGGLLNLVTVVENHVGGNAEVLNNSAGTKVASGNKIAVALNAVGSNLKCEGNQPPPTGEGNTAKKKLGQCELL